MTDENEVKALIARFWEVRQKLTAGTSETNFWAMVACEALRWRDETRPQQPAALAVPAEADRERVAKAIAGSFFNGDSDWSETSERARAGWLKHADAAIAALAQQPAALAVPDDAMVERALKVLAFEDDGAVFPDAYSDEEAEAEREKMRKVLAAALEVKL